MNFADRPTPGGYVVGEVTSAMQKAIRRGDERGALFWATELMLCGLENYVWKRLRIIASEDVGLAEPMACVQVRALYENWSELVKTEKPGYEGHYRVFTLHAVCVLSRAKKSRMLDHALMAMFIEPRAAPDVPDYAIDMHTKQGRDRGRAYRHFVDEATKLRNEGDVPDPYEIEGISKFLTSEPAWRRRGREED